MPELVRQHVRLGGIAALRPELVRQLIEEPKIQVHRRVGWAVEGSNRGGRIATGCIDAAGKGLHLDRLVALEIVVPVVLDRVRVRDKPAVALGVDV
jgi:hypothetical protein